jgi:hypothetical protein
MPSSGDTHRSIGRSSADREIGTFNQSSYRSSDSVTEEPKAQKILKSYLEILKLKLHQSFVGDNI